MKHAIRIRLSDYGECGLLVRFSGAPSVTHLALHIAGLAEDLKVSDIWVDVTPALDSLAVRFDATRYDLADARARLRTIIDRPLPGSLPPPSHRITVPVCYADKHALDKNEICKATGLGWDDVIGRHLQFPVRVLNMGFAPGFAYLGPVDAIFQIPRKPNPRPSVPASSVGVAAGLSCLYSLPSPGGWPIIGRTPMALVTQDTEKPFILSVNTEIRFEAISAQTFSNLISTSPRNPTTIPSLS